MNFLNEFLPLMIYILLIVLIVLLIAFVIKASKTMDKVDKLIDDTNKKMEKIEPVFDLVEGVSASATALSDRFFGFILKVTDKLFFRKKDKEEEE